MSLVRLPAWAIAPKSKKKVIPTDKGWVIESTGEVLRRVDDLPSKLKSLMQAIQQESTESLSLLSEVVDSSQDHVDVVVVEEPETEPQTESEQVGRPSVVPEPFDASAIDVRKDVKLTEQDFLESLGEDEMIEDKEALERIESEDIGPLIQSLVDRRSDAPENQKETLQEKVIATANEANEVLKEVKKRGRPRKALTETINTSTQTKSRGNKKTVSSETTDEANKG